MGTEHKDRELVVTQYSFGGFDDSVTAKELADFLVEEVEVLVWRCRLKKSWTPPESYPYYQVTFSEELENTTSSDRSMCLWCDSWHMDATE